MASKQQHERRVFWLALAGGLPAVTLALWLLWSDGYAPSTQWILSVLITLVWIACAILVREHVVRPLHTISNALAALREHDYSLRVKGANPDDALGLVLFELNGLGDDLRAQRLGALEAGALLRRVMEEIDVAIFAFDGAAILRLVNRSGAALLGRSPEQLLGRDAASLGLATALTGDAPRVAAFTFGDSGRAGRWEVRRGTFRQQGLPHQLLVLTDVSRALSDEERQAWRRLIRVLSHELNNSLAPIKSIADSLLEIIDKGGLDRRDDLLKGLGVIASRSESLSRLMGAYARLARLPPPHLEPVVVQDWVRRVVALETRSMVTVRAGPDSVIQADSGQLDQLLINLVRNAVDATLETAGGGAVEVGWETPNGRLEVWVRDDGPGLADTGNLFVPFYTTKPAGSGIGLALSRQIAEAHGGTLTLKNRKDVRGCEARLSLAFSVRSS
jgi:nitrogen fixation/metabolism regulation signal transduction histidine kinase